MAPRVSLALYDDAIARRFEPFALTRPWSTMRVGALLVHERWAHASGGKARWHLAGRAHRDFREIDAPSAARGTVPAGTLIVHSRCAVSLAHALPDAPVLVCHDREGTSRVAAVRLAAPEPVATFEDGTITLEALARRHHGRRRGVATAGHWCDHVWDVFPLLNRLLGDDIAGMARVMPVTALEQGTILGPHPVWVAPGATVEPLAVFDTTAGPVLLDRDARVQAFSRVSGPCYIGASTVVSGGRVGGSAIGPWCKVNGEVSATVWLGYANKGHDGFVGHSVLGRWVNLGAGTTTSNLKNTYGPVALWTPEGIVETDQQFLGTLFGDHVKTGIGLRLTTGCVLGAGANVVDRMPPKVVVPFAWGGGAPYSTYAVDKFLVTAERVMARRQVALDASTRRHLRAVFARRWKDV